MRGVKRPFPWIAALLCAGVSTAAGKDGAARAEHARQDAQETVAPKTETEAGTEAEPAPIPEDPKVRARVEQAISEAKEKRPLAERVAVLKELETYLNETADATDVPNATALRFQVALEPIFMGKAGIGSAKNCQDARAEMVYTFSSGTGFNGVFPNFVLTSLRLLAAACQDEGLSKPPEVPETQSP